VKTYSDHPNPGIAHSWSGRPSFVMKHIDGPLLVFRDGQMHWLTLWERFLVWAGRQTAESLERKRRPNLLKWDAEQPPNPGGYNGR